MTVLVNARMSLYYEVHGAGPAIVLAHGLLCDRTLFRAQVGALSRTHKVINVDLRGHGRSGRAQAPFSLYELADDILAILDAERIGAAVWCGVSMGGMVALRAALVYPNRVSGIVLLGCDAAAERPVGQMQYMAMKWSLQTLGLAYVVPSLVCAMLGRTTLATRAAVRSECERLLLAADAPSICAGIDALCTRDDLLPRLREIRVPALVLAAEEDALLPLSQSRRVAEAIPQSRLVVVRGAGHLSCIEAPQAVTDALLHFVGGELPTTRAGARRRSRAPGRAAASGRGKAP